jgi:hypothetical protein
MFKDELIGFGALVWERKIASAPSDGAGESQDMSAVIRDLRKERVDEG